MDTGFSQLGSKETPADTARVLDRQVAMIVWRTFAQSGLDEMAAHSRVPVINSLSDDFHPCQLLADVLTIREHFGETRGLKVAFIGDGSSNTAQSFLLAAPLAGMSIIVATPVGFEPDPAVLARSKQLAAENGATVEVIADPAGAALEADVVATDTWVSMGQEEDKVRRLKAFAAYTVTADLMAQAKPTAIFLHCLPADRGFEVAAEVIDGPQSKIWDEAENRLHAQKALMLFLTRN
jgi:ornithine carbamoyltransferase